MTKLTSVIIPTYNEKTQISDCLTSLVKQSYRPVEIIIVDDGSADETLEVISKFTKSHKGDLHVLVLKQNHQGPGAARNLGASHAKGEVLVFVDADMTFEKGFIKDLISPILKGKTIGTFSRNEMNANTNNIWSRCWNINRGWPLDRLIPPNYPSVAPVYRAILKREFNRVNGFDATGEYTDDWSLSKKLGIKSTQAKGAIYYHKNPSSIKEVFAQARWIGKNPFISGSPLRKLRSLVIYSFPISIIVGILKSTRHVNYSFIIFKIIYDFAVFISTVRSVLGESKYK